MTPPPRTPNSRKAAGRRGYFGALAAFAVLLLFAGFPSAALLSEDKPGWAIAALFLFALVHAATVASVALLFASVFRTGASRPGRWLVAAIASFAVIYVGIDARLYALTSLHIGRHTFGHALQPGAMHTLGITWSDLGVVTGAFIVVAVASAWLLRRSIPFRRALGVAAVLIMLDAALSTGSMVARFYGIRPLLGLDVAMPLAWAPRNDERLSAWFNRAPMATDDDMQFPSVPPRKPQTLLATEWPTRSERKPDILFVVFESLRPDALENMPVLSGLAAQSVRMTEHYSGGNCSVLGLFSLLTGLDPTYLGVEETAGSPVGLGALGAIGYEVLVSHGASLDFNLDARVLPEGAGRVGPRRQGPSDKRDRENEAWTIEWATGTRQKPSALILFLERTHWPYFVDGEPTPKMRGFDSWKERDDVQALKDQYLRSAAQSDQALGRILEALEGAGRLDSTVIIATGDHGQAFREHGVLMHGSRLDEEQIRVPLSMKLPGVDARQLSLLTTHQDVLPTLLSYLKADPRIGPGTGVDVLAPVPEHRLPVVGACGIGNAVGYAAIVDEMKLLYQLVDLEPRYVSRLSRNDVPLDNDVSESRRKLILEEAATRATALLKAKRLQAQGTQP